MPPPPSKEGDPNAAATGGAGDKDKAAGAAASNSGGGAAGGMIKVAAMKLAPVKKGKNDKAIELKADGTVTVDGKPAAKFKGDQVDSTEGTSMVTIGVDGSLVGNGVKSGLKFEGDDLTTADGNKLSVADDGTINVTTKDGKTDAVAKAEGGGGAKRAALIMLALYLSSEPAPAAAATPAKKGGAKPAGKKQKSSN